MGLGNHGKQYEKSRHNVGFMVADELARQFSILNFKFSMKENLKSEILKQIIKSEEVILAKPQTMMNASGFAVVKLLSNLAIKQLSDLWVVHDDLDLPLGKIKIRIGGGTAGHRGLESIVEEIGSADFVRFRLGIGHPGVADDDKHKEVERYVLESFSGEERHEASRMVKRATEAIKLALDEGIEAAMNKFNLK